MGSARVATYQMAMALVMGTAVVAPLVKDFEAGALERTVARGSPSCPLLIS